jgi:hypothetical protein
MRELRSLAELPPLDEFEVIAHLQSPRVDVKHIIFPSRQGPRPRVNLPLREHVKERGAVGRHHRNQ